MTKGNAEKFRKSRAIAEKSVNRNDYISVAQASACVIVTSVTAAEKTHGGRAYAPRHGLLPRWTNVSVCSQWMRRRWINLIENCEAQENAFHFRYLPVARTNVHRHDHPRVTVAVSCHRDRTYLWHHSVSGGHVD